MMSSLLQIGDFQLIFPLEFPFQLPQLSSKPRSVRWPEGPSWAVHSSHTPPDGVPRPGSRVPKGALLTTEPWCKVWKSWLLQRRSGRLPPALPGYRLSDLQWIGFHGKFDTKPYFLMAKKKWFPVDFPVKTKETWQRLSQLIKIFSDFQRGYKWIQLVGLVHS